MDKKRKVYAPFSLTSEAGVGQTPVEGYIDVNQVIYPTVNTGTVNENGKWVGVKANDNEFIGLTTHLAVADGGSTLSPSTNNHPSINMDGFSRLQIAIKVSNAGNYTIKAVTGPDTIPNFNLSPTIAGVVCRITDNTGGSFENALSSNNENISAADAWYIFTIDQNRLADQNNIQIFIVNNSGGNSDIEFAFRRIV